MKLLLMITLGFSMNVFGHGDHQVPGVIPSAPHGGKIAEIKITKHSHKKNAKEIFIEGILKNGELKLYPLEIDTKNSKIFSQMQLTNFQSINFDVKDARRSKEIELEFSKDKHCWSALMGDNSSRRLMISITAKYSNTIYKGKLQVEKK